MRGPPGPMLDIEKLDESALKLLRGKRGKRGKRGPPGPPGKGVDDIAAVKNAKKTVSQSQKWGIFFRAIRD